MVEVGGWRGGGVKENEQKKAEDEEKGTMEQGINRKEAIWKGKRQKRRRQTDRRRRGGGPACLDAGRRKAKPRARENLIYRESSEPHSLGHKSMESDEIFTVKISVAVNERRCAGKQ